MFADDTTPTAAHTAQRTRPARLWRITRVGAKPREVIIAHEAASSACAIASNGGEVTSGFAAKHTETFERRGIVEDLAQQWNERTIDAQRERPGVFLGERTYRGAKATHLFRAEATRKVLRRRGPPGGFVAKKLNLACTERTHMAHGGTKVLNILPREHVVHTHRNARGNECAHRTVGDGLALEATHGGIAARDAVVAHIDLRKIAQCRSKRGRETEPTRGDHGHEATRTCQSRECTKVAAQTRLAATKSHSEHAFSCKRIEGVCELIERNIVAIARRGLITSVASHGAP
jgi:hypothetical protein